MNYSQTAIFLILFRILYETLSLFLIVISQQPIRDKNSIMFEHETSLKQAKGHYNNTARTFKWSKKSPENRGKRKNERDKKDQRDKKKGERIEIGFEYGFNEIQCKIQVKHKTSTNQGENQKKTIKAKKK